MCGLCDEMEPSRSNTCASEVPFCFSKSIAEDASLTVWLHFILIIHCHCSKVESLSLNTGDAVNIASRMDSTGVPGRIQVTSHCLPLLDTHFEFESRGSVYVKGKDNMEVYLLKCKKSEPDDFPGPPECDEQC